MKTVAGSCYFTKGRRAIIFKNTDQWCNAGGPYQIILVRFHIIRQHILVVDHRLQLKVVGYFKAKIAKGIVPFVIGAHKYALLVNIAQRYIIVGSFTATAYTGIVVIRDAGIP